ncbi:hypothetical protein L3Q82_019779, partial [Scortum barcoo]
CSSQGYKSQPSCFGVFVPGALCAQKCELMCWHDFQVVRGDFSRIFLSVGYHKIAEIPVGACNISIRETIKSRNYLALQTKSGVSVINGNWVIDRPGVFSAVGTQLTYQRPNEIRSRNGESITAPGPLTEDLHLYLIYQQPGPSVYYEYSVLLQTTHPTSEPDTPSDILPLVQTVGSSHSNEKAHQGDVTNNNIIREKAHPNQVPSEADVIFDPEPTYTWTKREPTECSTTCGTGTRQVIWACVEKDSQATVPADLCDPALKPTKREEECNIQPCPVYWDVGEWSECSRRCGPGTQHRQVICRQVTHVHTNGTETSVTVAPEVCGLSDRPVTKSTCQLKICSQWEIRSEWSPKEVPRQEETALCLASADVRRTLKRVKIRKAPGPDNIPRRVLREYADQLACVLTDIFNTSLSQAKVPSCFKTAIHHSSAKKDSYHLTKQLPACCTYPHHDEVLQETGERPHHLQTPPHIRPTPVCLPWPNRSTEDAICSALHLSLTHLEEKNTHLRMLFLDFSSAFNTIIPQHLVGKLGLLGFSTPLCNWLLDFLTERPQSVHGLPTNTTVVGLIRDENDLTYREVVEQLVRWCEGNNLILNVDKTKEIIVDFRKIQPSHAPLLINNTAIGQWRAQQRLHFLRRMKRVHLPPPILTMFYRSTVESILTNCISVWCTGCTAADWRNVRRVCSVPCGVGQRSREVVCVSNQGDVDEDEECNMNLKPDTLQNCDMGACARSWFTSPWSQKCSAECGQGNRTRTTVCLIDHVTDLPLDSCEGERPPEVTSCNGGPCQNRLEWYTGPWGQCSAECGNGTQTRSVACIFNNNGGMEVVDEFKCSSLSQPITTQSCTLKPCGVQWYVTEWSACSRSCNGGYRVREVRCLTDNIVPSNHCDPSMTPESQEECNKQPCLADINSSCSDQYHNCMVVVQARLCIYPYYRSVCCASCSRAQKTYPNSFQKNRIRR